VTGSARGSNDPERAGPRADPAAPVVVLCREYAALAGAAAASLADFLDDVAALALRLLPTAGTARIRVRDPEIVTAVASTAPPPGPQSTAALAIPLVGGGDLAGVLELDPVDHGGFPPHERELAEVLAVLLTLSLVPGRAA
jgi:GAF domain